LKTTQPIFLLNSENWGSSQNGKWLEKKKKTGVQGVTDIVVVGWTKNYDKTFAAAKHCAENERNFNNKLFTTSK
jgi:hypothetical protein